VTENLISIKSEKKFFQLQEPTDSVLFRPEFNEFLATIDATKLKPDVYPVKLRFQCLNCVKPCSRTVKNLLAEITVTPSAQRLQSAEGKDDKKVQELSESGPQFPETFDMSSFSAFVLVYSGWPLALKYELEEGATASVTVLPLRTKQPTIFKLPATGTGQARTIIFMLPEQLGAQPQVAKLTFKADFMNQKRESGHVNFNIHALGLGPAALRAQHSQNNLRRTAIFGAAGLEAVSYDFQPFSHLSSLQADEVAIDGIDLKPSDALNASQGSSLSFSFRSTNDFPQWSASVRRQVGDGDTNWQEENRMRFTAEPITQGQPVSKTWNGKTRKGRVVPGDYKLMINAWTAVNANGGMLTSYSSPPIRVY
jgi:hypothetical protein